MCDWIKVGLGSSGIDSCGLGSFPSASSQGITQPRVLQSSWHGEGLERLSSSGLDVNLPLPLVYFQGCDKILPKAGLWMGSE